MTVLAIVARPNKTFFTHTFADDDPTDKEIIKILGGGDELHAVAGSIDGHVVYQASGAGSTKNRIVVGDPALAATHPKWAGSCTMSASHAVALAMSKPWP
jgi:hypothetical protein